MTAESPLPLPSIESGLGTTLKSTDGRALTDLVIGFGAVFLGHAHAGVTAALHTQLDLVWLCGRYPTPAAVLADARIRDILPAGFKPAGLYSTGMEAAEFAMRIAARVNGRTEFAGFARSMHGKSAMTASLSWDNAPVGAQRVHMLPFVDQASEDEILTRMRSMLATDRIAALFVEPIQGSNGGHEASAAFYRTAMTLCREAGTYCIFDEILTGLWRTGETFYASHLDLRPDLILFAKSMGNGYPVCSVAIPESVTIDAGTLPGSTFSGNPLASAAVAATLAAMGQLDMRARIAAIEAIVREALGNREGQGLVLRGRGALWLLELLPRISMPDVLAEIRDRGILVAAHGRYLRMLPAATIEPEVLRLACRIVADACARHVLK